ncbi:protease propeptide/inhibitor [Colletotrichum falcatum]|nr:protease propeptide/inhibitor [Colletotrichum falcatum]
MRPVGLVIKRVCRPSSALLLPTLLQPPPPQSHTFTTTAHCNSSKQTSQHTTPITMPTYIVTCKEDASAEQVQAAKKHATDQGGKIGHEYSLIKGFSVEFPEDQISTLASHEHVKHVEKDQEVKTQ